MWAFPCLLFRMSMSLLRALWITYYSIIPHRSPVASMYKGVPSYPASTSLNKSYFRLVKLITKLAIRQLIAH